MSNLVGSNLKRFRLVNNLSIRALAKKSGVSRQKIRRIERCEKSFFDAKTVCKLARALDRSTFDFYREPLKLERFVFCTNIGEGYC